MKSTARKEHIKSQDLNREWLNNSNSITNKLDFISVIQKLLLRIKRGLDVDVDVDFIFIFIYYGDC